MAIISNDLVKKHLRVDADDEDDLIVLYLAAAIGAAQDFLNRQVYESVEALTAAVLSGTAGDDPMIINDQIKAAVLLTVGHLYANREEVVVGTITAELPKGSRSLLQPYRVDIGI